MVATVVNAAPAPDTSIKFPAKPIRLLVSGVGGAGDFAGRLIAAELTQRLGQQVVVDNRPGGVTPGEILVKAQPDGYTLMMVGFVIWLSPFMRDGLPFDPLRDFAPVSLAISSPNVLVVHPSLRVKSVPGLPTVAASGLPGYESAATIGVLARAGTPPATVNLLHREIARYLRMPDAKERLLKAGIEAVGNTPEEFAAVIRDDINRKGKIIREADIRME